VEEGMKRDVRRRIWTSPFQSELFVRVGVYWLIYTFTLFNLLFVWRLVQEGPGDVLDQLYRCMVDNVPLFLCFLVVAPWVALDAVRFSNRLVGPLARFQAAMKKVTLNEPVAIIKLRQDDFLLDMQDTFNAMIEVLEARGVVQIIAPKSAANGTHQAGTR
jgi:hypothetical protein